MYTARPYNEHSQWKLRSRDISEKAKQNSARNNAKCSKCFHFSCNNSDQTWFFNALTFARSLGRCWKPRLEAAVFNTSLGTWRMLMHEKPCLIPILTLFVDKIRFLTIACLLRHAPWKQSKKIIACWYRKLEIHSPYVLIEINRFSERKLYFGF